MLKKLECGLFYKQIVSRKKVNLDSYFLNHLHNAQSFNDRLSNNYNLRYISKMIEYGYVYNNDPNDLVYMVGIDDFNDGRYRIESRLFVHPNYRRKFWKSPDNYETIKLQINKNIHDCNFLFKSREALNPAGFKISARLDNFFYDWKVHSNKVELIYKNNWQWIMYKNISGDASEHIKNLYYKV